jgi:glutamate racemase
LTENAIVFLDSGAGGLPYCQSFARRKADIKIIYVADRKNFPYGKKTKEELLALLITLCGNIVQQFNPALIVIACNTASVSALAELRDFFPHTVFVGTVPAVRPAILASIRAHIGVLGTERTIEDSYIGKLAADAGRACEVTGVAAPELVEFVEHKFISASAGEKLEIAKHYVDAFRTAGADAIVLGCTHFLFLLDEFKKAASPDIIIYDSIEGVVNRIETLLNRKNAEALAAPIPPNCAGLTEKKLLLVTGNAAIEEKWKRYGELFNFNHVSNHAAL